MADLELTGLTKHYGSTVAVADVDLTVDDHEFMTLLGPSGSGKTTILRMIAGYVPPTSGAIIVGGQEIQERPPEKRDIGMVFQSYALFPHLTVRKNVAFGLERRGVAKRDVGRRVGETLALVRLSGLDHRYPRELSGGQQQRVALARALVIEPTLLLLDEPLSNLDARLRDEVRPEIRRLQQELGITTILVTHDQEEALTVSDRVAVITEGRLQQVATPVELYERPANRFVAEFVGRMNLLPATREDSGDRRTKYLVAGRNRLWAPAGPERALLAIRPEAIAIGSPGVSPGINQLVGTVTHRSFLGELVEIRVAVDDDIELIVRGVGLDDGTTGLGERVNLWWPVDRTRALEA